MKAKNIVGVAFLFVLTALPQSVMAGVDPIIARALAVCRQNGVSISSPIEVVDISQFPGVADNAAAFRVIPDGRMDPKIYVVRTSWEYQHADNPLARLLLAAILVHEAQHGRDFDAGIRDKFVSERSAIAVEIRFLRRTLLSVPDNWHGVIRERVAVRDVQMKKLSAVSGNADERH